jgi:hypothetical protein
MSVADRVNAWGKRALQKIEQDDFPDIIDEAHRSVQVGSEITTARGQPVLTGTLRNSVQKRFLSKTEATIGIFKDTEEGAKALEYAETIETGMGPHGPITIRSSVGGIGSFAKTKDNLDKIVRYVVTRNHGHAE